MGHPFENKMFIKILSAISMCTISSCNTKINTLWNMWMSRFDHWIVEEHFFKQLIKLPWSSSFGTVCKTGCTVPIFNQ